MVHLAFGKMAYPTRYPLRYAHFPYLGKLLQTEQLVPTGVSWILDLGCGPGVFVRLCDRPAGNSCLGLELWPHQLRQAAASGGYNILVQANLLEDLPVQSDSMDVVLLSEVLIYLPDPPRMLNECLRVLRPGGVLCVYNPIVWLPRFRAAMKRCGRRFYHSGDSIAFDCKTAWRQARRPSRVSFYSFGGLQSQISAAGFRILRVTAFRMMRNRISWLNRLENHAGYYRRMTALAARFPRLAADILVIGQKAASGERL